jgi:two-component system response regulator YesN
VRKLRHNLISWFQTVSEEISSIVADTDKDRSNGLVKFAKEFIGKNYQKPITANDAAKIIPITPSYLMYLFKQKTGLTFGDYLAMVRMKKAKDLLENTELNISTVANEVGYQDANYFSRLFKNFEGITPSAFKNRLH